MRYPGNTVKADMSRCDGVDRGEMDDDIGLIGQFLQDRVGERRANELDGRVQERMWTSSDATHRVSGRDQLPSDHPAECAGGGGNQDLHLGSPPPTSTFDNRRVGVTCATASDLPAWS